MSGKDQYMRHLEMENENLRRELANARSELYKARLRGAGSTVEVEAIITKADQDRQSYEAQIDALRAGVLEYAPMQLINAMFKTPDPNVPLIEPGTLQKLPDGLQLTIDATGGNSCVIDYVFLIWSAGQLFTGRPPHLLVYPNSVEDLSADLHNRLNFLIRRSPMIDDLRGSPIPGVDVDTLLWAFSELAFYVHNNSAAEFYPVALDKMFEMHILPKSSIAKDQARRLFKDTFEASIKRMQKNGRGLARIQGGKPGRPSKEKREQIIWTKKGSD